MKLVLHHQLGYQNLKGNRFKKIVRILESHSALTGSIIENLSINKNKIFRV